MRYTTEQWEFSGKTFAKALEKEIAKTWNLTTLVVETLVKSEKEHIRLFQKKQELSSWRIFVRHENFRETYSNKYSENRL